MGIRTLIPSGPRGQEASLGHHTCADELGDSERKLLDKRDDVDTEGLGLLHTAISRHARSGYHNPCKENHNPIQATKEDCDAANLQYLPNFEDSTQCCVPAAWTCNLGTKKDCKASGVAEPTF
mmetsp:Transcript_98504/g.254464  ORF Transcript_98504/g.254464 Transcript_98504/m.254464 type:complete len:123 (+) Transcript_98504:169-537(+)